MKTEINISYNDLCLKSITKDDIDLLRFWKNQNKESFFHKAVISKGAQKRWFRKYSGREDDYMFIIYKKGIPVGCIGFRVIGDYLDLYNLIIDYRQRGFGYMKEALRILILKIKNSRYKKLIISVRVLKDNPAVKWYLKNGFSIMSEFADHYLMRLP